MLLNLHWWCVEKSVAHYREGKLVRAIVLDWMSECASDLFVVFQRRG